MQKSKSSQRRQRCKERYEQEVHGVFLLKKFALWFAKMRLCRRYSSEGDTVASIGSVATLPTKHLSVRRLLGLSQTLIRSGKDGEQVANRTRNIVLRVPVTAEERAMIERKMQQMGTGCFSVYARKMLIDGYVIRLDYSDVKAMTAELQKIGTNINQIAKRVNATGTLYAQDMEDIKGTMAEIWQLQRSILSKAP